MNRYLGLLVWLAMFLTGIAVPSAMAQQPPTLETPQTQSDAIQGVSLSEMVMRRDSSFQWEIEHRGELEGCAYLQIDLISQRWQGTPWRHALFILNPPEVSSDQTHALMMIAGGSWQSQWDQTGPGKLPVPKELTLLARVARDTQTPVAVLKHVPFQPMMNGRHEDALIAHTLKQYLDTKDPEWPLLPAMARAASAAMDAIVSASKQQWGLELANFTVTGASKRGWTTYLVGAADPRVKAIAPMVIDMLNLQPQMDHQLAAWGKYSPQIEDYTRLGLQETLSTPAGKPLRQMIDPFEHRKQLRMPKLILLGTNDPYWPADASRFYYDELPSPRSLLNIPNNGHGLNDLPRILGGITALHRSVCGGQPMPDWHGEWKPGKTGGVIVATSDREPIAVTAWIAQSNQRDFRDSQWHPKPVAVSGDGKWRLEMPNPDSGSTAVMLEARYETGDSFPLSLTTQVHVLSE